MSTANSSCGGAGGGGRIAVWYAGMASDATLTAVAKGGAGDGVKAGSEGEDGTVYTRQTAGLLLFVK